MRHTRRIGIGLGVALLCAAALARAAGELGYDPAADPFAEVGAARVEAAATDRLVLVVAGGDWCIWCHYLAEFLHRNPAVEAALESTFVVAKVYIGDETDNAAFFATLPAAAGYPHFWVLDSDAGVLASEDTLPLEDGDKSYDVARFMAFIERWRDPRN